MTNFQSNNINNILSPPHKGADSLNLDAHTTSNMKLERPKISSSDFNLSLNNHNKYSHTETTKHLNILNKDIYQNAKKEKSEHEFNFKRYFTIFGILGLLAATIAYFRKGKG